jgi:HK97 gp10 family phage protein
MSDDLGGWEFKTAGVEQTLEKMYIINEKLNSHVGDIAAAREIRDLAKDLSPVDTGHLRDSIRAWETVEGATVTAGGVSNAGSLLDGDTSSVNVDYAPYVEFGTGERGASSPGAGQGPYGAFPGMAAQPYMRPAINLEKLTQTIKDAIQNMLSELF